MPVTFIFISISLYLSVVTLKQRENLTARTNNDPLKVDNEKLTVIRRKFKTANQRSNSNVICITVDEVPTLALKKRGVTTTP